MIEAFSMKSVITPPSASDQRQTQPRVVPHNAAGEQRPTHDDAKEVNKSLPGGPSAPVAG
jgi:hypothetical protein